jgi:hypothetical protein
VRARLQGVDEQSYYINLFEWSMAEMNVPPYPARRVYRAIARNFLTYADSPSEVVLDYYNRPDLYWRMPADEVPRRHPSNPQPARCQ